MPFFDKLVETTWLPPFHHRIKLHVPPTPYARSCPRQATSSADGFLNSAIAPLDPNDVQQIVASLGLAPEPQGSVVTTTLRHNLDSLAPDADLEILITVCDRVADTRARASVVTIDLLWEVCGRWGRLDLATLLRRVDLVNGHVIGNTFPWRFRGKL